MFDKKDLFHDRPLYKALFYIAVLLSLGIMGVIGFYLLLNDDRSEVRMMGKLLIVFSLAYQLIKLLIGSSWLNTLAGTQSVVGGLV